MSPIKDGEKVIGNRTRVKIVKNKLAPPFREVELDVLYGRGFWAPGDLVDQGIESGVLTRTGAWISHGEKQLGQGRERTALAIEGDVKLAATLRQQILDRSKSAEMKKAA